MYSNIQNIEISTHELKPIFIIYASPGLVNVFNSEKNCPFLPNSKSLTLQLQSRALCTRQIPTQITGFQAVQTRVAFRLQSQRPMCFKVVLSSIQTKMLKDAKTKRKIFQDHILKA